MNEATGKQMTREEKSLAWYEQEYPEQTLKYLVSEIQALIDNGHDIAWGNVGPKLFIVAKREIK